MNDKPEGHFGLAGFMLRMTFRSPLKLCALCLLFAVIAFLLSGVTLLGNSVEEALATVGKRLGADLMVVPAGTEIRLEKGLIGGLPIRFSLPEGVESAVASMPGIRLVAPQYFLSSAKASCCETGSLLLVGFDPARDFTVRPWLQDDAGESLRGESVLIGGGVMKGKGASLRLYNRTFTVAGRLEKSGMGYFDNAVFIPLEGVAAMERSSRSAGAALLAIPWGRPSLLLLQLAPQIKAQEAAELLQQRIPAVRVLTIPELFREKREKMARIAGLQPLLVAAAWLLALVAGGALQLLYWRQRRPLLGLLQAWSWRRRDIVLFFGLEGLLLSLTGMVTGSIGALLLLRLFAPSFAMVLGLPLLPAGAFPDIAGMIWLWLVFAGAMATLTVLVLLYLLRHEPAELMRGD